MHCKNEMYNQHRFCQQRPSEQQSQGQSTISLLRISFFLFPPLLSLSLTLYTQRRIHIRTHIEKERKERREKNRYAHLLESLSCEGGGSHTLTHKRLSSQSLSNKMRKAMWVRTTQHSEHR